MTAPMSLFRVQQSRLQKRPFPQVRIRHDDVLFVSYPKSRNTWVRFILANLVAPTEDVTFRDIDNYVPDIHRCAATLEDRQGRRFIKSYDPCYDVYPKLIYTYRMAETRWSLTTIMPLEKKCSLAHLRTFLFSSFATKFSSWGEHVGDACDFTTKYPDRILMLQYERLLENHSPGGNSISTFLELDCDHQAVARAVKATSFDRLKAMEQNSGAENPAKPVTFFRSGRSGQWREYFSAKLYERFCSENGATLLRLGYEL